MIFEFHRIIYFATRICLRMWLRNYFVAKTYSYEKITFGNECFSQQKSKFLVVRIYVLFEIDLRQTHAIKNNIGDITRGFFYTPCSFPDSDM